jgi:hypothetical protein
MQSVVVSRDGFTDYGDFFSQKTFPEKSENGIGPRNPVYGRYGFYGGGFLLQSYYSKNDVITYCT